MGTNYLAPTWRQPENTNKDRLSNYSIDYDGSNDYITVSDNIFSGLETWSMAGFYNLSTLDVDSAIFGKYANAPQQILLYWDNPNGWRLLWAGDSSSGQLVQRPSISADEWHFIAVTYDGTTVKMYLDDQVYTDTASTGAIVTDTGAWQIGADGNASKDFNGKLSQLSFYDYAVGATEIAYLRNGGNPLVISGAEPIAYYPLGDNSNPTAAAGYPNIISDADAVFDFNTPGSWIDCGNNASLNVGNGDLSISAWVYPTSVSGNDDVCGIGANGGTRFRLQRREDHIGAYIDPDPGSGFSMEGSTVLTVNEWYHFVLTKNGTNITLHLNGEAVAEASDTTTGAFTDTEVAIGQYFGGNGNQWSGELSNVQIWNSGLDTSDIEDLYNNGLPLSELSEIPEKDSLQAWYKLNQSAVLIPGTPTNWTITKIGNPNFSGGNDGSYGGGTSETSPYNSGLIWHDNNSATVGSDYFQWNSPAIYTSGSNIVLSSSGGSWVTPSSGGNQAILEYNIDDGSWVTWHTQTNGIDGFGSNNFTIPSTGNLTVSNNIKIRIKGVDFGSTGSYLKINDINATGGTSSYNEGFTNATRYGFSGGGESQPPATFSADEWDIPDNRSAYPQSFNFKAADSSFFNGGDILHNDGQTPMSVTGWVKITTAAASSNSAPIASKKRIRSAPTYSMDGWEVTFISSGASLNKLYFSYVTNGVSATGSITKKALSKAFTDGLWHHVAVTYDGSGNADGVKFYVDGDEDTSTQTLSNNLSGSMPNDPSADFLIGKTPKYGGFNYMDGDMSNIQIWDSKLESSDVLNLYNNGVPLPTASVEPSNLKLWTRLDSSSKWNTITSQWNIPINPTTPIPWSKSAIVKSSATSFMNNPTTSGIDLTNPTTTSFWFKSKTPQPNFAINAGSLGGGGDLAVIGERILIYRGSNNYRYFLVNTTTINDNNWHNLIFYVPGYANADIASSRMFMDGIELDVQTTISSGNPAAINNNPILGAGNIYLDIDEASFSNAVIWSSDQTANVTEIYNNGTPASSYTDSPILWWKLNNLTSGLDDLSGNGNNAIPSGPVFAVVEEDIIAYQLGVSDGMTEANLIEENVSVVNAESDTLPASALVQSDLTRKLPFSNYSVLFNGVDESFNCGPGFQYTDITVSCWIKLNTWGQYDRIYQTGISGGGIGFLLVLDDSLGGNKINAIWGNPTEESVTSSIDITTDTWYHILWTRNASEIKMYINGADVSGGSSVSWGYGTGNDLELGRKPGGGNNFDGDLSNMAIWNSVLTQEEILDVYNNGVPTNLNTSFTPGQPEYWWPMDEDHTYFNGSVLIARDAVGSTDATGANVIQENIVGNAPGSTANGIGSNLTIADLKGDMQNSTNNSYSINMADYADGVTNPADSGRSTNVP